MSWPLWLRENCFQITRTTCLQFVILFRRPMIPIVCSIFLLRMTFLESCHAADTHPHPHSSDTFLSSRPLLSHLPFAPLMRVLSQVGFIVLPVYCHDTSLNILVRGSRLG